MKTYLSPFPMSINLKSSKFIKIICISNGMPLLFTAQKTLYTQYHRTYIYMESRKIVFFPLTHVCKTFANGLPFSLRALCMSSKPSDPPAAGRKKKLKDDVIQVHTHVYVLYVCM